jgi:hypothetical protein
LRTCFITSGRSPAAQLLAKGSWGVAQEDVGAVLVCDLLDAQYSIPRKLKHGT